MGNRARSPRRRRLGAMLAEMLIAIFVLAMGALSLAALMPVLKRSQVMAEDHEKAQQIANRMIEHLQMLRPSNVNAQTLTSLNLIDAGQSAPPYSFSDVPMDYASRYSPSEALKNGTGELRITALDHDSIMVEVIVGWDTPTGTSQSIVTGTVIGGYK